MSRLVFEEVAPEEEARRKAEIAPRPGEADRIKARNRRLVGIWLMLVAAFVLLIALVGAATRLTESGLSIVEWRPVAGALPPMNEAAWAAEFEKYKQIPQFQQHNQWMTLADFKGIYWWEWVHRLLGRLVGVVFFLPFVWFAARRMIPAGFMGRILIIGLLGGLQGAIGWWMVSSGLADRTSVAPYRLATHLGLAALIFSLCVWNALSLSRPAHELLADRRRRDPGLAAFAAIGAGLLFLQILLGALVAGLDAGKQYTDWPMMGGAFFPPEGASLQPFWVNFFEDAATTQFMHRMNAYLVLAVLTVLAMRARRAGHQEIRARGGMVFSIAVTQVVLGILALMQGAPFSLAMLHQLFAFGLLFVTLRLWHEIAHPREERLLRG